MTSPSNKKTAIILGATGLTGGLLTELLLKDSAFAKVKILTRRPTHFKHEKVEEIICNLLDVSTFEEHFTGDVVFCCIGTTKAKTPDKEKYHAIDYGIPINTAQLAKANGIKIYMVVSSMGTSAKSPFFYVRTKGEMERDLLKVGITNTFIIKPAFINGRPDDDRKGEKWLKRMMAVMDFFMVGPLKKWKSTQAEDIARAMAQLAKSPEDHPNIENQEIKSLSLAYRV
ncbi:NAD-dependent epimerase/dehydratase family protein [Dokdonia sinensis]|uniref:NAD-dependent epimerase/dehydratase family protein n=1 Tax=Dokdonia sinensis TaxID=2479847 RepID=A0A3M0FVA4_9FLAO|nr:NAD(P)H-binding protein [Dokdonia sinensis]RMB56435.1 NAD-dependent epimerase/dehydratase family protein [Dokdonia sinensis]